MEKKIERKTHLFDAKGKILGRLAGEAALILRGKNKVDFDMAKDLGDAVVIINSDNIKVSGNKEQGKIYYRFSGYPGGIRSKSLGEQRKEDSRKLLYWAIRGMLPKNSLRDRMLKRLHIFKGDQHDKKIDIQHK